MFDEQNQNPIVPKNLPTEPEDMVAGVDKNSGQPPVGESVPDALSNGLLKRREPSRNEPGLLPTGEEGVDLGKYKMSEPILGKILLFVVIILFLGGLAYAGWRIFYSAKSGPVDKLPVQTVPTNTQTEVPPSTNQVGVSSSLPAQINNDQILFGQGVDLDKDGLDDVREKEIKTNPQNPDSDSDGINDGDEVILYKSLPLNADTDSDGLSDGDEVLIWKTNVLNPDTDGDSYPDGAEVKNGYSPVGSGKLFSPPTTSTTSSASVSTT